MWRLSSRLVACAEYMYQWGRVRLENNTLDGKRFNSFFVVFFCQPMRGDDRMLSIERREAILQQEISVDIAAFAQCVSLAL